jgi:hypothetical protein
MKPIRFSSYLKIKKSKNKRVVTGTKTIRTKIDPHHCRCFSIPKLHFRSFESKMLSFGYSDPILEEDHGQILSFTKRLSEYYQIHVKLMRTGRIEAEMEYPHDYPLAHLNQIHSFSAHAELNLLLIALQIPYKCKRVPPITCVQRQVIPAQNPTTLNTVLALSGVGALADIIFNNGEITSKVLGVVSKQVSKNLRRKARRRKYLL